MSLQGSILGNRVQRKEDARFLTVGATYLEDIPIDGAAYVTYVRSPIAHGRILSVDVSGALTKPGVIAVFTGGDVDLPPAPVLVGDPRFARPMLAADVVRFVGEAVAAVVTEERYQGEDAAEQVIVDYEPLPAVVRVEDALAGAVLLFPEAGSNVVAEAVVPEDASVDDAFAACDVVIEARFVNQRVAPCPLEVQAAAAQWDDGRLTLWSTTQTPHGVKGDLATFYGLDPADVRVVAPDVGGGFGAKFGAYPEALLLPFFARRLGRPVRFVETRSESMLGLCHGRAQHQHVRLGGTAEGQLLAYDLEVVQDAGAYGLIAALLANFTGVMTTGVYAIPTARYSSKTVVTNTAPVVAYRGAGRPEACAAIERAVDLFAAAVGLDPTAVRRRNLVTPDRFPYTTPVGTCYDSGQYERALDLALERSGYETLRKEQARRREAGDTVQLGIGVSTYVEITSPVPGGEFGELEITEDGRAVIKTGSSGHGQGHDTSFAMVASDILGIPLERIDVVHGDTDAVAAGVGTFGSRSLQLGGSAVRQAAQAVLERAKVSAADALEAAVGDIVVTADGFQVQGSPTSARTWAEIAVLTGDDGGLREAVHYDEQGPTFPFGSHVAVVEVDVETGKVDLVRLVAVDDAGPLVNPLIAEGQIHGGLAQGTAQALLEAFVYDDDGNPLTTNLADYPFISAAELPSFELASTVTPTTRNALGVKGIGESGTIGSSPAVQNAVIDALSHLGVRHLDMPMTPSRVWAAITAAAAGNDGVVR